VTEPFDGPTWRGDDLCHFPEWGGGAVDDLTHYMQATSRLSQDNANLREAGNELAKAAHRVSTDFDGVHRLRLALAGWYTALANEGGRKEHG
jgi:hypothetical protein